MSSASPSGAPVVPAAPVAHPTPSLVVVGSADPAPRPLPDAKWLAALPAARRVLAVGQDACRLAKPYRMRHPDSQWVGVALPGEDLLPHTALEARWPLDTALGALDLNEGPLGFDLLLLSPSWWGQGLALSGLQRLSQACLPQATLVLALDNAASLSRLAWLLQADLTPEGVGADPAAAAQVPATVYKLLMDAGWSPSLADHHPAPTAPEALGRAMRQAADALGMGVGAVDVVQRMERLIVTARRLFDETPRDPGPARFTVVVPTNEERQLRANVEASPGLAEVRARIVSCRQTPNPAAALAQALPHCHTDWVLLAHQDVYFPQGFGEQLNAVLATIAPEQRRETLIGFIGMGVQRDTHQPVPAGHVIDRLHCADHAASDAALSLDEVAVVLSRDSLHRIDPAQGWHLWATELCLTAIAEHRVFPRIVRLPLFHNSRTGWSLPSAFVGAAERLIAKHPGFVPIHTLCGRLDASFVAQHRRPAH